MLSAAAPTKAAASAELVAWMDRNSAGLFLSVITVAEVAEGIAKCRRQGGERKAKRLTEWLDALLHLYSPRILPLDTPTARMLGDLADQARAAGQAPGLADLAIAATGRNHGLTVLTRNVRHFDILGVPVADPFARLPPDVVPPGQMPARPQPQ